MIASETMQVWDLHSENKYGNNLLTRFGHESAKNMRTPMGSNEKLTKDEEMFQLILKYLEV